MKFQKDPLYQSSLSGQMTAGGKIFGIVRFKGHIFIVNEL